VSKRKRRWSREFKEAAVARMEGAETIYGLAAEPGVRRELLFKWRRTYEAGGGAASRAAGRSPATTPPPSVIPGDLAAAQCRIEELERKIGQQQLDLDFFRAASRRVREQRPTKGGPGGTTSSR
jgi:transposase